MEVSRFVKNTCKLLSMKMRRATYKELGKQAVFSAEIIRELRDDQVGEDKIYSCQYGIYH